ncbi:MAG TPA: bifunctional aspartate kinase/homoserine dehydrogenase I, partial [Stenotrophomonas sp.]|nr:bifunctional aspartate kinase/homoserine dehydrogenase I [Stenotrophomonas sp.]
MSFHAPAHPAAPASLAAPSTVVHKFGGTSVANAERYRHVAGLLLARPEPLQVTVVSAMKGVTDALIELAQLAARGDAGWREAWYALRARHRGAAVALLGEQVGETVEWIDVRFDHLA